MSYAAGNNYVPQLSNFFFSKENEIPDKLQPVKSIAFHARSERPFSYVLALLWRTVIRVAEICLQ